MPTRLTFHPAQKVVVILVMMALYTLSAYLIVAPLSAIEVGCIMLGNAGVVVAFWQYLLLYEKFYNGEVFFFGGQFFPLDA